MAAADSHSANGFSADAFSRIIPGQPPNPARENAWVPPAPANNQQEGIPPPNRGVAEQGHGRMQNLRHIDVAYQGIVDYYPQPLVNPAYIFPDVGVSEHQEKPPLQTCSS